MTYGERQAKGRILCEKLAEAIAYLAPEEIGRWDRAWQIVDAPGAEFMTALSTWETEPSDITMQRISDAYDAVMAAWHAGVSEYVGEGAV